MTAATLLGRVRQSYEDHPYPGRGRHFSYPPPIEWLQALLWPGQPRPFERILVAGCGTGAEALALRRRYPRAEIVAFDFSPASIAIARASAQRGAGRPIHFLVADLDMPGLHRRVGRGFDFISCHGVLTYVASPRRALEGLARCLAAEGALYLGVNGAGHAGRRLRTALKSFGLDVTRFTDDRRTREVLSLCDAVVAGAGRMAEQPAACLSADVFGSVSHDLSLSTWSRLARRAGLHLHGSSSTYRDVRTVVDAGHDGLLIPRSRGQVHELLDALHPSGFHRMVLAPGRPPNPPWNRVDALRTWRPVATGLYRFRLPARTSPSTTVTFTSPEMNTRVQAELSGWQIELVRQADGTRSIEHILSTARARPGHQSLVRRLYSLHQLAVLSLVPPGPRPVSSC